MLYKMIFVQSSLFVCSPYLFEYMLKNHEFCAPDRIVDHSCVKNQGCLEF